MQGDGVCLLCRLFIDPLFAVFRSTRRTALVSFHPSFITTTAVVTSSAPADVGEEERTRWMQHPRLPRQIGVYSGAIGAVQEEPRRFLGWA